MKTYMILVESDGEHSPKDIRRYVQDGLWKGGISWKTITVFKGDTQNFS